MGRGGSVIALLGLSLLVTSAKAAFGGKEASDGTALLERAWRAHELRSVDGLQFQLRAEITLSGKAGTDRGEYQLVWVSQDRWREELSLPGYTRLRIGVEGGYQQARNPDYEPQSISELMNALRFERLLLVGDGEESGRIHNRKMGRIEVSCVEIKMGKDAFFKRELCFDISNGLLLRAEFSSTSLGGGWEHWKAEYSEFKTLAGKSFPGKIRILTDGSFTFDVLVSSLQRVNSVTAAVFDPPKETEFWGDCDVPKRGVVKDRVPPDYPQFARSARQGGTTRVYARIEPDGSVSHTRILQSAGDTLDGESLKAIQQWKYQPPSCGGIPIRAETFIDIIYTPPQ